MNYLTLKQLTRNVYTVTEYNSEKLFVISLVLLNHTICSSLKNKLEDIVEEFTQKKQALHFTEKHYDIHIAPLYHNQLTISTLDKTKPQEEDNPLIIDLYKDTCATLIDAFEELKKEETPTIYIVMQGDTITAQSMLPAQEEKT
jgi:hypothetical protein